MNEVVLPKHLFYICTISTIPGPTPSYRFPTFSFGPIKPMEKLNAAKIFCFVFVEMKTHQLFRGSSSHSPLV